MDLTSYLPEIHPVTGSKIQSQFRDALANRFHIAEKSLLKAINTDADTGSGWNVESIQPFGERFSPGFVLTNKNLSALLPRAFRGYLSRVTFKSHLSVAPSSGIFK